MAVRAAGTGEAVKAAALAAALAVAPAPLTPRDVDVFLGTGGYPHATGNVFPGATTPFGLVRLSPDGAFDAGTFFGRIYDWLDRRYNLGTSGYWDGYTHLRGFSHTRLSGAGVREGGLFRVTPGGHPVARHGFARAGEDASPGVYRVTLADGTAVALTATTRVGLQRYVFPAGAEPKLYIDATSSLAPPDERQQGRVRVLDGGREIEGESLTFGHFTGPLGGLRAYFVARPAVAPVAVATWDGGKLEAGRAEAAGREAGAELAFAAGAPVELRVGISYVSLEGARRNLDAEAPAARTFEEVAAAAEAAWAERLGRVAVDVGGEGGEGGERGESGESVRRQIATALYRTHVMPTDATDVDGSYRAFGGAIEHAVGFRYRVDLSLWDTYRGVHQLYGLIAPDVQRDALESLTRMARAQGSLPMWPVVNGDARCMIGSPATIVLADAWLRGERGFAVDEALAHALKAADRGTCAASGVCDAEKEPEAVSRTLEYAQADFAAANLARGMGREADAATLAARARGYEALWDEETRHFRARVAGGKRREPFVPWLTTFLDGLLGGYMTQDFTEGSAAQWRWAVALDADRLIAWLGGAEAFARELERFMEGAARVRGAFFPGGEYWHGNEHNMHAPYLFLAAGRPELTQKWVRWALTRRYGEGADGLDGQDDAGALSAWYVWSAFGLHPVAGSDRYWIGAPLVRAGRMQLGGGKVLEVQATWARGEGGDGHGDEVPTYVASVTVDGVRLCEPELEHARIAGGAKLVFALQDEPAPGGGFDCGPAG